MFEEAKSEALRALGVFEKLGATNDAENTRKFLGQIDQAIPDKSADDGELSKQCYLPCVLTQDHRIRMMVSTLASNSPDATMLQATNASSIHPIPCQVPGHRYYPNISPFSPPRQERPLLYLPLQITHRSGLVVLPPVVDLSVMLFLPVSRVASTLHVYILWVSCDNPCSGFVTQRLPQNRLS